MIYSLYKDAKKMFIVYQKRKMNGLFFLSLFMIYFHLNCFHSYRWWFAVKSGVYVWLWTSTIEEPTGVWVFDDDFQWQRIFVLRKREKCN